MTSSRESLHGMWSSRLMFILAVTGSAVGLGNIWRFPYITSENGGGAFVLIYLGCILILGLPIMIAEIAIGRHGRRSPINSLRILAKEAGANRAWAGIGWLGLLAGVLILSFYSVIAGWTLHYVMLYFKALFTAVPAVADADATFGGLVSDPVTLISWHAVFMLMTLGVVAMGVEQGLEKAVRFLMPALFVILVILVIYGMTTGYFGQALKFLFQPDFSQISGGVVIQAMGQAFFTLSLGMGSVMAYGAYLPREVNIARTAGIVALTDTGVAIIAGLAIFPLVFAYGMSATDGGPGLIFSTLPRVFTDMSFGGVYGLLFFVLLTMAAWTSSISMLEPGVAYLVETGKFGRKSASFLIGAVAWVLGLGTVLSFNEWSEFRLFGRNFQELVDHLASDFLLPLCGLLIALFMGWILKESMRRYELPNLLESTYKVWRILLRYVAPILVVVVLLSAMEII